MEGAGRVRAKTHFITNAEYDEYGAKFLSSVYNDKKNVQKRYCKKKLFRICGYSIAAVF